LNPQTLSYKTIKVDGYGPLLKPVQAVFLPGRQYVAVGSEDSFVDILHDTGAISRIETDVNKIDWLAAMSCWQRTAAVSEMNHIFCYTPYETLASQVGKGCVAKDIPYIYRIRTYRDM